jgi:nicotinamidase/pyrazinamidase
MLLRPVKGIIMKRETIFWDVDTQYDLMRPEGRLYIPGAEGIIDNVNKARRFALDNGYSIIAAVDWHQDGNPEISNKPDFKNTFPPHCMAGTPGSERVGYLGNLPIGLVPNEPMSDTDLRKLLGKEQFHIAIVKENLDVFTNPNTTTLLEILKPRSFVVFGVALDLCVKHTIEGLLKTGGIHLYLLRDTVKTLGLNADKEVLGELKNMGVEIISVSDLNKKF